MHVLNGEMLPPGQPFTVGEVQYPGNVLILWSAEELAAIGVTFVPDPALPGDPIRVSRLDFRRLLRPEEAARFRLLEAAPRVTAEELASAFDPEAPDPTIQIRVAVEDAIGQWGLLDQGVIELDHPDTAQFLDIMALAGMFGGDGPARIARILANLPPQP